MSRWSMADIQISYYLIKTSEILVFGPIKIGNSKSGRRITSEEEEVAG